MCKADVSDCVGLSHWGLTESAQHPSANGLNCRYWVRISVCYIPISLTPCHFYLSHILLVSYLSKISASQTTASCCCNMAGTFTLISSQSVKSFLLISSRSGSRFLCRTKLIQHCLLQYSQ